MTMYHVAFGMKGQVARLAVTAVLLVVVELTPARTPASSLDKSWLEELLVLLLAFFTFLCCLGMLPVRQGASLLFFVLLRVIFGVVIALFAHTFKGFTLYSDLSKAKLKKGYDPQYLYYMRVFFQYALIMFTIYLVFSLVCLCMIGGADGVNLRERGTRKRLRNVPFGQLLFAEGVSCAVCMERFQENESVVQLSCHETHVYHKACITQWVERGKTTCPHCRLPIE